VKTYGKGGRRISDLVRNKKGALKGEQGGIVYSVPCMNCEVVYIGETRKKLQERPKQHKDDVRLKRDRNAIYKHVQEEAHDIDCERAEILEQDERMLVRKWKETRRIKETGDKTMNWNAGLTVNEE